MCQTGESEKGVLSTKAFVYKGWYGEGGPSLLKQDFSYNSNFVNYAQYGSLLNAPEEVFFLLVTH